MLSDDPQQLALVQSALVRDGRGRDFVPLETQSLVVPAYHRFLHQNFPQRWPEVVSATQTNALNPYGLIQLLALLARTNDLYYLHPSFGYYFERFYLEPHGLVYKMAVLPADTLLPPLPDKNLIAENETFWTQAKARAFAPIEHAAAPPDPNAPQTRVERCCWIFFMCRANRTRWLFWPEPITRAAWIFLGLNCSAPANWEEAAARFDDAQKLNPDNVVARINLQFNKSLRAGSATAVDLSKATTDQFGKYQTWSEVLNANGPFDEPSFCFENGVNLAARQRLLPPGRRLV